jgi:hypothetical protein
MNPEKLQEILVASKKFWQTNGMDGSVAVLTDADLTDAVLTGADLTDAVLTGADLTGADCAGAVLTGADLTGADCAGAVLRGADLTGADLTGADLTRADLTGADLTGADLTGADLTGADCAGAVLTRADLRGAVLTRAGLRGAVLRGAAFAGAKGLTGNSFGITPDPTLPKRVAQSIIQEQSIKLRMVEYHTCETTHCLAGSAVHLSGPAGYALEKATSPSVAGAMLMPSACHLFLASNEVAMEWLKAQLEPLAN